MNSKKFFTYFSCFVSLVLLFSVAFSTSSCRRVSEKTSMILATTTSTEDSGLLGVLLPEFEKKTNIEVKVVSVGTGQAIAIGEKGDADCLLVHDRAKEDLFVEQGHGSYRMDVMYNDFILIGPKEDPANLKNATDISEALKNILATQSPFVSRGDQSGTHSKESSLWKNADIQAEGSWYISAGQGMGAVLLMADEKQAYTLTDRATYLKYMKDQKIDLQILFEGADPLLNPYGVIPLNPEKHPKVNFKAAEAFAKFITSLDGQKIIEAYGKEEFGAPLFFPDSENYRKSK